VIYYNCVIYVYNFFLNMLFIYPLYEYQRLKLVSYKCYKMKNKNNMKTQIKTHLFYKS